MKDIKSVIKKPMFWVVLVVASLIFYFIGGFVVKTIISVLLLGAAYLVSKFTGPYMRKRSLRRTIDDMVTRRTNWDGTLKQANQMYGINKVAGYFMPYIFAIVLIISIWTAKEDAAPSKIEDIKKIESIEMDGHQELSGEAALAINAEESAKTDIAISDNTNYIHFEEDFPTPEYIYMGLLNSDSRDMNSFFSNLIANGFMNVELLEYSKDSTGSISFESGSAQDMVYIQIYEYSKREQFEKALEEFFKDKNDCSIDYCGDGSIIITKDY